MVKLLRVFPLQGLVMLLGMIVTSCNSSKAGGKMESIPYQVVMNGDTIAYTKIGRMDGGILIVEKAVDLHGCKCDIPQGINLCFKGGTIKNGALNGHGTRIMGKGVMFDKVAILGSWNVPNISTNMFADLSYENALVDVVALSSDDVQNRIIIEEGNYPVRIMKNGAAGLQIRGNAHIELKGTITMIPNEYPNYSILSISCDNVHICGKGTIVGDKHGHFGKTGEWGMGISIWNGKQITISGITVKDCWGDCIYIGGESEDVKITKCHLDNGRRQGVSITSGVGVTIRDCVISNVSGTAPEYAIDVEPNANNTCDNIIIRNVNVEYCKGGFAVYGKAQNAHVGSVIIRKSSPRGDGKSALSIIGCDHAIIEGCTVFQNNAQRVVECRDVKSLVIRRNTIFQQESLGFVLKKIAKKVIGRSADGPICITNCENSVVEKIIEK